MNRKTVLNNGVRIVSERLPHVRSVSLGIWVNTGSRDESPPENGVSHFIEHMSFKGTHNRSGFQIAKDLDAIGGLSNAFTGEGNHLFLREGSGPTLSDSGGYPVRYLYSSHIPARGHGAGAGGDFPGNQHGGGHPRRLPQCPFFKVSSGRTIPSVAPFWEAPKPLRGWTGK